MKNLPRSRSESAALRRKWTGQTKVLAGLIFGLLILAMLIAAGSLQIDYSTQFAIGTPAKLVLLASAFAILLLVCAGVAVWREVNFRHERERVLREERALLESIIEAMPNQVYVKDAQGRFLLGNASFRATLGEAERVGFEGRDLTEIHGGRESAEDEAEERELMESGRAILHREEAAVSEEAEVTWFSTNKVPLRGANGEVVGLVCVRVDITRQRESVERMKLFSFQLERSNQMLRDFASVASHDLQEPLRKIQAFGDRLRVKCATLLTEQGRDYLERIENAAGRMQVLIEDLLTLSRVTSNSRPFQLVDLNGVVRGVLSDLEVRIEQTAAQIEVGKLPSLDGDAPQLRQLFQNLLANALKFHAPGRPPVISVTAKVLEMQETVMPGAFSGEDVCQICVEDNGIGFDNQFAEKIFTVFQRLHSRSEYAGTGIGLAVCRKITDRHGGRIVAKSSSGGGAVFTITLPLHQHSLPDDE